MSNVTCYSCGILFGIPDSYEANRRKDHEEFYCPNGHKNYFPGESETEKYKRLYNAEAAKSLSTREQLAAMERQHARTKRQFQLHKKRSAAGVCPCCNRTVAQLAKHMQSKHKDFVALQGIPMQKQLTDGSKPN